MEKEKNYFNELSKIECKTEKKNGLTYVSWSDAWAEVKKMYPDATYRKLTNTDGSFLFKSWTWGMVLCEVVINWISHTADLAVTDFKNQEIKYDAIKSTDIQNTTQRTLAKAIAMHWIGLYVYRGEDIPRDWEEEFKDCKTLEELKVKFLESPQTKELTELKNILKTKLS